MLVHNNKMNPEELVQSGFTKAEAMIYLALLKTGSISVHKLAEKIDIDRTSVYHTLNNLERKGMVSSIIKNNKKFYDAAEPENLLGPIKAKEQHIKEIIAKLKNIERQKENPQNVKVYEGKEGLRVLYNEILKAHDLLSYGATGKIFDILQYEIPHVIKMIIKQKFKGKVITHSRFRGHPMSKVPGMRFRYLDTVDSLATTTIYGDSIAINVYTEKPLVIIIKNQEITKGYRNYFEYLWKTARS
jgi:sugar-specific transcriptional regulator TrmB